MPKQILKIDQFHGGMNDDADPRDIGKEQMVSLKNVMVNKYGRIQMMGAGVLHTGPTNFTNAGSGTYTTPGGIVAFPKRGGYNLFSFSHSSTFYIE